MPVRILGSGSGWEILTITLRPYINFTFSLYFVHPPRKLIPYQSFIFYLTKFYNIALDVVIFF